MAVLGAGSWGTAIAVHLSRAGQPVRLWVRESDLYATMRATAENRWFLPGVTLPSGVEVCDRFDYTLDGAEFVVVAVPSHGLRQVVREAAPHVPARAVLVSATKGIEEGTLARMSEVIGEEVGGDRAICVLSGPSFAAEVARERPTAVSVASSDASAAARVQAEFRGRVFRLYTTADVVGVEIGAALKNVIAIAAGVVEGLGLGHNALAALITRGLAEITRLACALGGHRDTLAGLAGLGDLVLTCTGQLSRNRQVGAALARGRHIAEIVSSTPMVAEGVTMR
jgi:glycerol-3-phosphate dehydrogenase (NAD(P)+)